LQRTSSGRSIADRRLGEQGIQGKQWRDNAANAADLGVEIKGTEGAPGQVVVYIPKDVVGELTAESKIMVMVAGQDGYGVNRIRQVTPEAQQWRFGGGNEEGTAPAVIDMIV